MSWQGNIESRLCFQVIIYLHRPALLKDTRKTQFLVFWTKKDDPVMAATNLFILSIYIHLKIEMEAFVT